MEEQKKKNLNNQDSKLFTCWCTRILMYKELSDLKSSKIKKGRALRWVAPLNVSAIVIKKVVSLG